MKLLKKRLSKKQKKLINDYEEGLILNIDNNIDNKNLFKKIKEEKDVYRQNEELQENDN